MFQIIEKDTKVAEIKVFKKYCDVCNMVDSQLNLIIYILHYIYYILGFLGDSVVKNSPAMQKTQ